MSGAFYEQYQMTGQGMNDHRIGGIREIRAAGREKRMRIWFKMIKDNRLLKDYMYEEYSDDTRTHKVFRGMDEVCMEFDLGKPIWLDATIADFKRHAKARFTKDCFVEEIDFDYLEIHVIEED